MKFTCERDVIMKEIQIAQEIISSRNALSILSNVLLSADDGALLIRATDLKVSFETRIPIEVSDPGTTTVFCDKLLSILRTLPQGEVSFEIQDNDRFVIKPLFKNNIDFRLKSIGSDKFPEIQTADRNLYFELPQKELIEMISQTVFAVSDDETRYYMNGVYLVKKENNLVMVATDGRRLSYIAKDLNTTIPEFEGVIIPPKILHLIRKLASGEGSVQIAITDKHMFIEFDNQKISSALIEGTFPTYQRVIPESQEYSVIVSRDELMEALKRVGLMVEKSRRILLTLTTDTLTLKSEESELGIAKEDIPCRYEGPDAVIALNYQYITDPLRVIDASEIQIQFTETNRAISIYSIPEADYFHIIMPMQLD
ncbi:DNA polymerase III subunit beta [Spirochaeta lutea]|uniref:Beta sliding clamp n=1 Tax=Spirochaeta lutea TaxID=1480694 RepID=A0A098QZL1_9SPIO|nr:DNA polymerase III subunit beta [Spirochaeta lutea]KGE71922.1 DNA polymerase III subunit beta [Spirochaeta lutea]